MPLTLYINDVNVDEQSGQKAKYAYYHNCYGIWSVRLKNLFATIRNNPNLIYSEHEQGEWNV